MARNKITKAPEFFGGGIIPIGTVLPYLGVNTPENYLFCNGQTFNQNEYPALYDCLKTTTLPNLTDGRFLEGSSTPLTFKNAGLPNITGSISVQFSRLAAWNGAFTGQRQTSQGWGGENGENTFALSFDANNGASTKGIYGNSTTVQPKSLTVRYIIRAK